MNQRIAEIKLAILEDKKKAGVLAVLAIIALIVGVRAIIKTSPRRAGAAPPASAAANPQPALTHAGPTLTPSASTPITIASIDAQKLLQTTKRYAISASLTRDPFALSPDAFPRPDAPKSGSAPSEDQSDASPPPESEANQAAETLRRMRVRSLIIGPRPVAVVELRDASSTRSLTVTVGDDLQGFTVSAITPLELTLTRDGSTHSLPFEKNHK